MAVAVIHFLLVYDMLRQEVLQEPRQFDDADEAGAAYGDLERQYRNDPNVEVVLVGADSIETIKRTHGNYFNGQRAVASPYLDPVS